MKLLYSNLTKIIGTYGWLFMVIIFLVPSNIVIANPNNNDGFEELRRLKFDNDGKLILAAHTDQQDIFLSKVDSNGTIIWRKTFGGSGLDELQEVVIDNENDIYVVGITESSDFEVLNAFQSEIGGSKDYFISKYSSDGDLLWSTFYGGNSEEQRRIQDSGYVRLTSNNELVILGFTSSDDLPVSESALKPTYSGGPNRGDLFICKFSSSGQRAWASYIGSVDEDWGIMEFDNEENILIRGFATSDDITNSIKSGYEYSGGMDAYLLKINQEGNLVYSLYYGGTDDDYSYAWAVDNQNNVLMLAPTFSEDFPIVGTPFQSEKDGDNDLTLTKFSPSGDVIWNTYFGGNGQDDYSIGQSTDDTGISLVPEIFVNSNDDFYFKTGTYSTNLDEKFPEVFDYEYEERANFIGKLSYDGDLLWGRYLTGEKLKPHLLSNDEMIVTAAIFQNDWQIVGDQQNTNSGSREIGIAKLMSNGTIQWSSYLGGSLSDEIVNSVVFGNKLYVVGYTTSDDLPSQTNQYQGGSDVFVCQVDIDSSIDWCRYFGTPDFEYTFGEGLVIDPNSGNLVVFLGTGSPIGTPTGLSGSTASGHLEMLDPTGNSIWSQEIIPELRVPIAVDETPNLRIMLILLGIFSSLLVGGQLYRINKIKSNVKIAEMLMNESISNIISPLFNNKPDLIYLFGIAKQPNSSELPPGLASDIPKELLDYNYLMQPLRMSVVKLLVDTISLTSVQIKELLDVSWNDLHPQLKSMQKKKYITMDREFVDGNIVTIVRAEPNTIAQYKMLKGLLMEFFDATPNIERYIEQVNEWKKSQEEPNLYPKGSNNHNL